MIFKKPHKNENRENIMLSHSVQLSLKGQKAQIDVQRRLEKYAMQRIHAQCYRNAKPKCTISRIVLNR